jgi:hypothetical protein
MLKFLRIEPKLLIKLWTWNNRFSAHVQDKRSDPNLRRDKNNSIQTGELVTYELTRCPIGNVPCEVED